MLYIKNMEDRLEILPDGKRTHIIPASRRVASLRIMILMNCNGSQIYLQMEQTINRITARKSNATRMLAVNPLFGYNIFYRFIKMACEYRLVG